MKITLAALAVLFLSAPPYVEVKVAGEMKKIMRQADLSAHISLDTLVNKPHIYSLGRRKASKVKYLLLIVKLIGARQVQNNQ